MSCPRGYLRNEATHLRIHSEAGVSDLAERVWCVRVCLRLARVRIYLFARDIGLTRLNHRERIKFAGGKINSELTVESDCAERVRGKIYRRSIRRRR